MELREEIRHLSIHAVRRGKIVGLCPSPGGLYCTISSDKWDEIPIGLARSRLTPGITRSAHNLETILVSRMKAALFAVGCMPLLDRPKRTQVWLTAIHRP